jgi:mono/diheme cytochrome c family protein
MTFRMRPTMGLAVAACLAGSTLAAQAGGQTPAQTTLDGVYTSAQAARGDTTFASRCTGCHTAASFRAGTFLTWADAPVSELFAYLRDTMPEDAPGSLTPAEYADVIAFLLKTNDLPAGETALPADRAALAKITIKFRSH